ncbi:MAG: hypothetical protein PHE32_01400 [Candidatus Shapirobacteria bacterium]|nr:hypothetical protein [Candidatus Shapirobacteria bacterium]MDD4410344.1 hypothetical protein [Candidatus Shapirobacteria bacterium]
MIKELFLAIALGSILGFGITGAFFALNKNKTTPKQNSVEIAPTPTVTDLQMSTQISTTPAASKTESSINITSPENNTVLSNSKISIKGDSTPNSLIVISTPTKTFSDKSNANGVFSISIELDSGINLIKVNSIDPEDNQSEVELSLTYSTAKI